MNTRESGNIGEDIACDYLEKNGYRIIARNYYAEHCEVDIICEDDKYLIFTEVKSRADTSSQKRYGRPARAVNYDKRRHIVTAAKKYMREHPTDKFVRIDVIEVYINKAYSGLSPVKINHIKGAFGAEG